MSKRPAQFRPNSVQNYAMLGLVFIVGPCFLPRSWCLMFHMRVMRYDFVRTYIVQPVGRSNFRGAWRNPSHLTQCSHVCKREKGSATLAQAQLCEPEAPTKPASNQQIKAGLHCKTLRGVHGRLGAHVTCTDQAKIVPVLEAPHETRATCDVTLPLCFSCQNTCKRRIDASRARLGIPRPLGSPSRGQNIIF